MNFPTALFGFLAASAATVVASSTGDITLAPATAMEMVQTIVGPLNYLTITSASFTGATECAKIFTNGNAAVSAHGFPDEGVVISTGLNSFLHQQDTERDSHRFGTPGDADLNEIVDGTTFDACALEFTFDCMFDPCPVEFKYVFGSEEYLEYVDLIYNDVFAWFLNGNNIALIPGTTTEVSIDTVNDQVNSQFFVNNPCTGGDDCATSPYPKLQADGFTVLLKALGVANKQSNTMKLVIADRQDANLNSWALIKADSFVYVPPSGGAGGDPHFMRWGQHSRDSFHGECDMVLVHAPEFHNGKGLDVHVRTTIESFFSYIESAAIRIGKDIVEINRGNILLNGHSYTDADLPLSFGAGVSSNTGNTNNNQQYQIVLKSKDNKRIKYAILLEDGSELQFRYYKQYMTFDIEGHPGFDNASGMLGQYPTGAMLSRDGNTVIQSFEEYGFEWQVNPAYGDAQLFAELRSPQLPYETCRVPTGSRPSRRKLRGGDNKALFAHAQQACAKVHGSDFQLCVDDVLMTGDIEMAHEW